MGPPWQNLQNQMIEDCITQHSVALTVADEIRRTAGVTVRLLTQDPDYSDRTRMILAENGFEVVGQFGAGGFAEVDEESVVFSVFPTAPVKQIIADIARPVLIIQSGDLMTFNANK